MIKKNNDITLGIILILIGVLFLLNTLDIIGYNFWNQLFSYWPLFLIIIGANILLKNTKLWWISPLLIIFILVVLFVPVDLMPEIVDDYRQEKRHQISQRTELFESEHKYIENYQYLDVFLAVDAGRIDINSLSNKNNLFELSYNYHQEEPKLNFDYDKENNRAQLFLNHVRNLEFDHVDVINDSKLNLHREVIYNINIESGIGRYNLDLKELLIKELTINTGISEIYINYNDFSNETSINSGASNIEFEFPADAGIQIETSNITNREEFTEAGFNETEENIYQNEEYNKSDYQINIIVSSPAPNIEVSFREN
ncbi:MAG: LiaF transmembrane domain-containing protein [Bacillota bacterium]